ncbi:MAG: hypothetical protein SD837_02060 [Candidatus Electrothrix scaldis]|nr:MAG: hypothetical protein SD837_02060 [Candidatus Electrothrix sp. GW3-3]
MTEPNNIETKSLLDHNGKPIPSRKSLLNMGKALSRKTKTVIVSSVVTVAAFAALLTNVQTIQDFFKPEALSPTVPPIVIEISNSSEHAIDIAPRGDFFLWLPGSGARHTIGKYEIKRLDSKPHNLEVITVDSSSKVRVLARVMNQKLYGQVLEQADCDIAFMVHKVKGGLKVTDNLPFTKDAIDKYSASVDIGND